MSAKTRTRSEIADTPIRFRNWANTIKEVKPKRPRSKLELHIERYVSDPKVAKAMRLERGKGFVDVVAPAERVGRHFFPPVVKTVRWTRGNGKSASWTSKTFPGIGLTTWRFGLSPSACPGNCRSRARSGANSDGRTTWANRSPSLRRIPVSYFRIPPFLGARAAVS